MKKTDIMVAVRSHDGKIPGELAYLLKRMETLSCDPTYQRRFHSLIIAKVRPAWYASNIAVGDCLSNDYDWLWFMDADIKPPLNWERIFDMDGDIVAGPCLGQVGSDMEDLAVALLAYRRGDNGFTSLTAAAVGEEIDAAGLGCLLIRRSVFEDMAMRLPGEYAEVYRNGPPKNCGAKEKGLPYAPPYFRVQYAPNGRELYTDDVDFCWRAKIAGFRIVLANTGVWNQTATLGLLEVARFGERCAARVEVPA